MPTDSPLLDGDIDLVLLGSLLKRARREAGLKQKALAARTDFSERTLSRWESGALAPSRDQLLAMLDHFGIASDETLDELRRVARLVPEAGALAADGARAGRPPTVPAPPPADLKAALDDAVRAYAEDLDVSARRLRAVAAALLGDIERLGLSLATARDMIARGPTQQP